MKKNMNNSKTRRASGTVRATVLGILIAGALLAAPGTASSTTDTSNAIGTTNRFRASPPGAWSGSAC